MSFEGNIFGFLFKIIWFIAWGVLTSVIMWIINIFKFINYSIAIAMNK